MFLQFFISLQLQFILRCHQYTWWSPWTYPGRSYCEGTQVKDGEYFEAECVLRVARNMRRPSALLVLPEQGNSRDNCSLSVSYMKTIDKCI